MTDQPALDLDAIAARAAHLHEYATTTVPDAQDDFDQLTGTDVPALIAALTHAERIRENADFHLGQEMARRQLAEKAVLEAQQERDKLIRWHREDEMTREALLAEIRHLRAWIRELERPIVEAERNKIRDSYADLAAATREIGDYEGAFEVACRLRDREEQWNREDAALVGASIDPGTAELPLAEVCRQRAELAALERDSAELAALHAAGVDNWEGYDDALDLIRTATPSGPASGAVSVPQPTRGPHSAPDADEATHSHTGGPTATPAAP